MRWCAGIGIELIFYYGGVCGHSSQWFSLCLIRRVFTVDSLCMYAVIVAVFHVKHSSRVDMFLSLVF